MYLVSILKVDVIDCKTKRPIIVYLFALEMACKSTITSNINVFEKLNINQLSLSKENP